MFRLVRIVLFALIVGPTPSIANPDVAVDRTYYSVDATDIRGLLRQMQRRGPNGFWGYTAWYVRWTGGCAVSVEVRIELPRHANPAAMPDNVRRRWDGMIAALVRHEEAHVHFGISAASEIRRNNCNGGQEIIAKWVAIERAFDRNTQHGRRDGVVLD